MDNRVFAMLMARHCTPRFADLVLQVSVRHSDDNVQHRLVSAITHGSQMAQICQNEEASQMIYSTTEHLFSEATPNCIQVQEEAHRVIVSMISHAANMAGIATEGADEILGTVRAMAYEPLPQRSEELRRLNSRLEDARRQIADICHRVNMDRFVREIDRQ